MTSITWRLLLSRLYARYYAKEIIRINRTTYDVPGLQLSSEGPEAMSAVNGSNGELRQRKTAISEEAKNVPSKEGKITDSLLDTHTT